MGESSEFGPEFTEEELSKLEFAKDQVEKGKIGGPEDKPREDREFTMHPEPQYWEKIDPAWKNIPTEMRQEIFEKYGGQITKGSLENLLAYLDEANVGEDVLDPLREEIWGEGFVMNTLRGSATEQLFTVLKDYYPELGVKINDEATDANSNRVWEMVGIWMDPNQKAKIAPSLEEMLLDDAVFTLFNGEIEEGDVFEVLGQELEEFGVLPSGATQRIIARTHKVLMDRYSGYVGKGFNVELNRSRFEKLGVEPYTDEEVQELFLRSVVVPALGPPKSRI